MMMIKLPPRASPTRVSLGIIPRGYKNLERNINYLSNIILMTKKLVKKYYAEYGIKEWKRLAQDPYHRLEFDTTMYFLKK